MKKKKHYTSAWLSIELMYRREATEDWIYKTFKPTRAQWKCWHKLRRYETLYGEAIECGWEKFDWKKAHESGFLCENDYDIFKELKSFKPKQYGIEEAITGSKRR